MKYPNYLGTPQVIHHGVLNLRNCERQNDLIQMGFYIMPRYDMNLAEYLMHFEGKKRLDKIAEVTI